jgi:hypothetical protein
MFLFVKLVFHFSIQTYLDLLELFKRKGTYDFSGKDNKSQELANLDSPKPKDVVGDVTNNDVVEKPIEKPIEEVPVTADDVVEEPIEEQVPKDETPIDEETKETIEEDTIDAIMGGEEEEESTNMRGGNDDEDDLLIEDIEDHKFSDDLVLYEMFQNQINSDHEEEEEEEVVVKPKKQKKPKRFEEIPENVTVHILKSEEMNHEPEGADGIEKGKKLFPFNIFKGLAAEIEDEDEESNYPALPFEFKDKRLTSEDEKRMTKYKTYFERGILDEEEYLEKQEEIYSKYL